MEYAIVRIEILTVHIIAECNIAYNILKWLHNPCNLGTLQAIMLISFDALAFTGKLMQVVFICYQKVMIHAVQN